MMSLRKHERARVERSETRRGLGGGEPPKEDYGGGGTREGTCTHSAEQGRSLEALPKTLKLALALFLLTTAASAEPSVKAETAPNETHVESSAEAQKTNRAGSGPREATQTRPREATQTASATAAKQNAQRIDAHSPEPSANKAAVKKPDDLKRATKADLEKSNTIALPSGADKSGVTSKAISLPKGAGSIKGMEESFSAQLSTGIATFNVPLALPGARGAAQPSLALSYSSSGGLGVAGMGWQVGVPFIARQTDRGLPRYDDQQAWHPEQDRFVFNGGQELVPICLVGSGGGCQGALPGEVMPVWAAGWQYFRARVEGSFLRFFFSPDKLTWRVQDKSGVTMELGVPLDDKTYQLGLEVNPDKATEIYRWCLVRQYDTYGSANPQSGVPRPANQLVYRYQQSGGMAYLSDIYATPPASTSTNTSPSLASYAHHVRLAYETRTDPTASYRSGWKIAQSQRLARIDVTSRAFSAGAGGPRRLVRRTHLGYDPTSHVSLLESVTVEGRCQAKEDSATPEGPAGFLPEVTGCPKLPPMRFSYQRTAPFDTQGKPSSKTLPGFEGFDERLISMSLSPPHSVDEELSDLFDIDQDSLPDVLVTAPGQYGPGHGVFFNGESGDRDFWGKAKPMQVFGLGGANATSLSLKNLNIAALDIDGDGGINLLHMPKVSQYAVYEPRLVQGTWRWSGRSVKTTSGTIGKIDLGKDALETKVADVNFDGLVDVIVTKGTEVHTYLALGRYPGGDGRFGSATWTSATTASLSEDPLVSCVPWSATPVRFSDDDIKLSDMNGDGIVDIVQGAQRRHQILAGTWQRLLGHRQTRRLQDGLWCESLRPSRKQSPIHGYPRHDVAFGRRQRRRSLRPRPGQVFRRGHLAQHRRQSLHPTSRHQRHPEEPQLRGSRKTRRHQRLGHPGHPLRQRRKIPVHGPLRWRASLAAFQSRKRPRKNHQPRVLHQREGDAGRAKGRQALGQKIPSRNPRGQARYRNR